jgi:serine/threonine protein kinase
MSTSLAAPDEATLRLLGATVAGKYRVDRLLGQGGMGAVFQATNTVIGKRVALKFLSPEAARDAQATRRFQREAEAASLVESEHIVQIFDFGETEQGLPFLVMELLNGQDLRARLNERSKLGVTEAVSVAKQVLRALVRAHAAGIVHRDLKPDNVFLCERESGEALVKIVDFGISKLARRSTLDTLTQRGTILGTAYYMSPEQAQGVEEVDERSDLYSVGAILYEMLAGRPPHRAPTYEAILVAICTRDAEDVRLFAPETGEGIARVLRRALARDRTQRFESASEMLAALERAENGELEPLPEDLSTSEGGLGASRAALGRSRRRTGVAALIALLLGFAATAFLISQKARRAPVTEAPPPPTSAASPTRAPLEDGAPLVVPVIESAAPPPSASVTPPAPPPKVKRPAAAVKPEKAKTERGVIQGLELNTKGP